jgi:2-polyprenyl-6-methoxyphenol hydroxylase-like FAD-dependent oxidoreductase
MAGAHLRTVTHVEHARAVGGISITQRGRLHGVLHENLPREIALRFGVRPVALRQGPASVEVSLSDGSSLESELLVGADGANSSVRRLAMPEVKVEDCGGIYAGMTVTVDHGLSPEELIAYFGEARIVSFLPLDDRSAAVVIYQDDTYEALPAGDGLSRWADYVTRSFAGAAEPVRRILGAVKPGDDFYQDRIRLVPPTQVASGRVALLGDAGYCPSFLSGNGAALAMVGAYCLARYLRDYNELEPALAAYQARIVPFAAGYQANANRLRSTLFEHSAWKNALRRFAIRYMPSAAYARMQRRHYKGDVHLSDVM